MTVKEQNQLATTTITQAMQLILACARSRVNEAQAKRIRQLLAIGLDRDYLLKAAGHHGMMPQLPGPD